MNRQPHSENRISTPGRIVIGLGMLIGSVPFIIPYFISDTRPVEPRAPIGSVQYLRDSLTVEAAHERERLRFEIAARSNQLSEIEKRLNITPEYMTCSGQNNPATEQIQQINAIIQNGNGAFARVGDKVYFKQTNALCSQLYSVQERQ